jgi:hypothetical protein
MKIKVFGKGVWENCILWNVQGGRDFLLLGKRFFYHKGAKAKVQEEEIGTPQGIASKL